MKVLGKKLIDEFSCDHADVRSSIASWLYEAEEAEWETPADIKARYPHASILGGSRVVFNLKGNNYRLDTKVDYRRQIVVVLRIGTHAEYDKWDF